MQEIANTEITILKNIIKGIPHVIVVDAVVNSATQSTITTCNTLYLNTSKFVTIDAIKYKVVSFVLNTTIVLEPVTSGDPLVDTSTTSFTIPTPNFHDRS